MPKLGDMREAASIHGRLSIVRMEPKRGPAAQS
jgi:hypothetical protein